MTHLHCPPNSFIWQCKLFLMSGYVGFRLQNKPNSGCAYWCTRLSWVSTSQTCWHWSLTALAFFWVSFWRLGTTYDVHLGLIGKHFGILSQICARKLGKSVCICKSQSEKNQWRFFIWTLCIMCLICGLWLKCAFVKNSTGSALQVLLLLWPVVCDYSTNMGDI